MANPKWFDAETYLANKLLQLNAVEPKAAWTSESLNKAMEEAGYKGEEGAYQHFLKYGMDENISPNDGFDVKFYLQSKADALNAVHYENKVWDAVSVMDAIKANGMHSAWEHYQLYGSQEGIATSAAFDSEAYFIAKVAQMNATREEGRSNWGLEEVKGIFAEKELTALEHYNLYGQDENVAKYGAFKAADPKASAEGFDPYTGAQTYTLEQAIEAHTDGSIAAAYELSSVDSAGTITVAEYNGLDALIAGATNAATLGKADPNYTLEDTVAAIDGAPASAVVGSTNGYKILDTFANVVAGNDALVTEAATATATINFAATDTDNAVVTSVKYADIDGKATAKINIAHVEGDANTGNAVVVVDASAEKGATTLNLTTLFDGTAENVTFNAIGSAQVDTITAHAKGGVITGGAGADAITAGAGVDKIAYTSSTASALMAEAGSALGANDATRPLLTAVDKVTGFTAGTDKIVFSKADFKALTGGDAVSAEDMVFANATSSSGTALAADATHGARFYFDAATVTLYFDANGDSVLSAASPSAASGMADDFAVVTLSGVSVDTQAALLGMIELA